ncbi:hypothetical protein B5C34_13900 [Pacificimonas flava]|uniref:Cation/H+ exchanger transmembrane domain-containing protein n=2 Tax=Pacificimonas TaxID=1960290 RepID=A0A219B7S1_9SPHN|nr:MULTISPECIES: cation:proton antiporter [Pacificimonas]MBZ6379919.1 cation:proton antiporter [Pacificimonas aurantium]OWV34442.1 hypothetical protein B5C34_13900 [Pacificimonas flava]
METVNLALAIAAGTVLVLTLTSGWIKTKLWGSEAMVCVAVGLMLGPYGLHLASLDPVANDAHASWVEQMARATLALSVMSAALSLPPGYFRGHWKAMGWILLPGMALIWAASAGIAYLFLDLSLLMALLAGAIVTPTDPVLARSIVAGRLADEQLPPRTPNMITAESGANDGLALPMVLLPLFLMDPGGGDAQRSLAILAWEVLAALLAGWVLGKVTGRVFSVGHKHGFSEQKALTGITLALAFLALAAAALMHADGVLAVFVAGLVLNQAMADEHQEQHEHFQDAVDRSLTLPVFILFGLILPVGDWLKHGWPLFAAAGALILFRRAPVWLLLQLVGRPYTSGREALFAGWFGPVGVAALFYAAYAAKHGASPVLWPLISLTITFSVAVHGVTGTPLTRLYGKLTKADPSEPSQG